MNLKNVFMSFPKQHISKDGSRIAFIWQYVYTYVCILFIYGYTAIVQYM